MVARAAVAPRAAPRAVAGDAAVGGAMAEAEAVGVEVAAAAIVETVADAEDVVVAIGTRIAKAVAGTTTRPAFVDQSVPSAPGARARGRAFFGSHGRLRT